MGVITSDPGLEGLGAMLADLIRANIEREPDREKLVRGVVGTVNIVARDAGVEVGIEFAGDALHVFDKPFKRAGIEITCDAATLMDLTTVPLIAGQPDVRTKEGRAVLQKIFRRELRVKGMVAHPILLGRLQRLLSAA